MISMFELEKELYAARHDVDLRPGDTLRVHFKIREGDKSRVQVFEGTLIGRHRAGPRSTLTVRKISYGVGVERVFPLHSPTVEKIEVVSRHKVRRAKLYFLRALQGKKARLKPLRTWRPTDAHSG